MSAAVSYSMSLLKMYDDTGRATTPSIAPRSSHTPRPALSSSTTPCGDIPARQAPPDSTDPPDFADPSRSRDAEDEEIDRLVKQLENINEATAAGAVSVRGSVPSLHTRTSELVYHVTRAITEFRHYQ